MTPHFIGTSEITVALPPPDAMSLFTPEGERSWAGRDGWNPHYPDPSRTVGAGAVFRTEHEEGQTVWVMTDHEPHRVRYARLSPDGLAGTVEVHVRSGSAISTTLQVTYDLTALTDAAADHLAEFADGYQTEIATWSTEIADSLTRRRAVPDTGRVSLAKANARAGR